MRRTLQKHVESPLSVKLLRGEFAAGDTVMVDATQEGIVFRKAEPAPAISVSVPEEVQVG